MLYSPPIRPPVGSKPKPTPTEAMPEAEPRNRLRRRSKAPYPPRSQTVPNLLAGGTQIAAPIAGISIARVDNRPLSGSSGRRSNDAPLTAHSESPTPSADFGKKKKKHSFPWRSKDKNRSESKIFSPTTALDALPNPDTANFLSEKEALRFTELPDEKSLSPKAAKLLGLPEEECFDIKEYERKYGVSARHDYVYEGNPYEYTGYEEGSYDDTYTEAPVEYPREQKTWYKEIDLDDIDPPQAAPTFKSRFLNWKDGNKKTTSKSGLLNDHRPETKRSISDDNTTTRRYPEVYNGDGGYSSDDEINRRRRVAYPHLEYSGPLVQKRQKPKSQAQSSGSRRRRKKLPKPLDTMTTISEVSSVSGGSPTPKIPYAGRELPGISEDDTRPPVFTFGGSANSQKPQEVLALRRRSVSDPRALQYQLPTEMLASSESEEEEEVDEEDFEMEVLPLPDPNPLLYPRKVPEMIQIKSPLQTVETKLLDNMERLLLPEDPELGPEDLYRRLAVHTRLERRQAAKGRMDDVYANLKASHEKLKLDMKNNDFRNKDLKTPSISADSSVEHPINKDEDADLAGLVTFYEDASDDEGLDSSQNDENYQFEPIRHEEPQICEAVAVKMRSFKDIKMVDMGESAHFPLARKVTLPSPKASLAHNKPELCTIVNAGNGAQRTRNAYRLAPPPATRKRSPLSSSTSASDGYSSNVSSDVFSGSVPAPPPKDDAGLLLSQPKHQCIVSKHDFRPISLKNMPNDALIDGVRPYYTNSHGFKQHVNKGVHCDWCNELVKDELWQCSVPVCRLGVCYACANREVRVENKAKILGGTHKGYEQYEEGDMRR